MGLLRDYAVQSTLRHPIARGQRFTSKGPNQWQLMLTKRRHHHDWAFRRSQQPIRDAADQHARQSAATMGRHDDQIDMLVVGAIDDSAVGLTGEDHFTKFHVGTVMGNSHADKCGELFFVRFVSPSATVLVSSRTTTFRTMT